MKNLLKTLLFSAFLFAAYQAETQNQFLDYELVCWDSSGVNVPLFKRIYDVNGIGKTELYFRADLTTSFTPSGAIAPGPCAPVLTETPPSDQALSSNGDTDTSNLTIPAGAKYVKIENKGGLAPAGITVNGLTLEPGDMFERSQNWDGVNRYTLPSYVIVTNGSLVLKYYEN